MSIIPGMATVFIGILCVMALAAALQGACQWAVARFPERQIAPGDGARAPRRALTFVANSAVSVVIYAAALLLLHEHLVRDGASRWYEAPAALLLYDLLYYFMHRTFHLPRLMRLVHGVHHRVRHPTAVDSLYLHPVETAAGLCLLLASVAAVGPVGAGSFILAALAHSLVNIIIHANLTFPHRALALTNHWAVRHCTHHTRLNTNYASIFPFWDLLFGTYK